MNPGRRSPRSMESNRPAQWIVGIGMHGLTSHCNVCDAPGRPPDVLLLAPSTQASTATTGQTPAPREQNPATPTRCDGPCKPLRQEERPARPPTGGTPTRDPTRNAGGARRAITFNADPAHHQQLRGTASDREPVDTASCAYPVTPA